MKSLMINNKLVTIWSNDIKDKIPIVYTNVVKGNGREIWENCIKLNCKPFILVTISNLNWNDDMSPWEIPAIYKGDKEYKGLANEYLQLLIKKIIPEVEKMLGQKISYSIIAGYSLAGLFAMWSCYNTSYFSKVVCCSSSFWFPKFMKYIDENELKTKPESIYFSLGDEESKTKNQYLKDVEKNTKEIYKKMCDKNIKTILQMNSGNHFKDAELRMAKGICWVLS